MQHAQHDGAEAPGLATSERLQVDPDSTTPADGPALQGTDRERDRADCADDVDRKQIIDLIARAALAGIEVEPVAADAWLLRYHAGRHIGIVHGRLALAAAVGGLGLLS